MLKNIVHTFVYIGFSFEQLYKILLFQVSKRRISEWVNKKEDDDFKRIPVQFSYELEYTQREENIKNEMISEDEIRHYIDKLFDLKISIYSFNDKNNLSLLKIKKLSPISRIKKRKR